MFYNLLVFEVIYVYKFIVIYNNLKKKNKNTHKKKSFWIQIWK